jgi:hypothetical protein
VRQAVTWASRPLHGNTKLIVTPANATSSATTGLVVHIPNDGDTGKGEASYAGAWDEFPHARPVRQVPRSAAKTNGAALAVP